MIKVFQHDRVKTKRTTMSMMIEFTICVALVFIAALVSTASAGDITTIFGILLINDKSSTVW